MSVRSAFTAINDKDRFKTFGKTPAERKTKALILDSFTKCIKKHLHEGTNIGNCIITYASECVASVNAGRGYAGTTIGEGVHIARTFDGIKDIKIRDRYKFYIFLDLPGYDFEPNVASVDLEIYKREAQAEIDKLRQVIATMHL